MYTFWAREAQNVADFGPISPKYGQIWPQPKHRAVLHKEISGRGLADQSQL